MGYKLNHGVLFLEEIYTAIINCENIKDSAMILLMLSSNMNSDFLSVLTVGDLLDACSDYLHDKDSITELLELGYWSVVPCWRNVDNQKIVSFNTPEATFHILLYLKKRQSSGEKLNRESPLFLGKGVSHIAPKTIRDNITDLKSNDFHVYFSQTSLLKTFKFVCENYCDNKELMKLLLMEDVEINPLYSKTSSEVREYYKPLIPFLTARLFDNRTDVVKEDNPINSDNVIFNYYGEYMKHRNVKYNFKEELEIKKRAKEVKYEKYGNARVLDNYQLNIIYKCAECEWLMLKTPYLAHCRSNENSIVDASPNGEEHNCEWIWNCFKELGIIKILEISEEKAKREIIIQSVEKDVSLKYLTYCGLLRIFDGLLEAVLLEK